MSVDEVLALLVNNDLLAQLIPLALAFFVVGIVAPVLPWGIGRIFKVVHVVLKE